MPSAQPTPVRLVPVDTEVLERLVAAATAGASADDVTPPLTRGGAWTPERTAWLRSYHRRCRQGLSGSTGEATWAVTVADDVVGSVRLQATDEAGVLETGIWLTRDARGRGIGRAAVDAVLEEAALLGAVSVRAETTVENSAAQNLLRSLGFDLTTTAGSVRGAIRLDIPGGR